jgi:endonuclease/exonuclease/phosphatase family metal-dependent hydrolase
LEDRDIRRGRALVGWSGHGFSRAGAVVLTALLVSGCATARNYPDPDGPRYAGGQAVLPQPRAELRIVSFNIEYGRQIETAIALLRTDPLRDADVIALQEMDAQGVARIAEALAVNYVFFPSALLPKTGRDFGAALLSPWPLLEPRKLLLPHASRIVGTRRAATIATLDRGVDRYRVYSVHLPSPLGVSGADRRDQARAVIADSEGAKDPVLISGDMNARGLGELFEERGFLWLSKAVGTTTRRYGLSFSFDHVFARGLASDVTYEAGVVRDNRKASDHRPIWVVLRSR